MLLIVRPQRIDFSTLDPSVRAKGDAARFSAVKGNASKNLPANAQTTNSRRFADVSRGRCLPVVYNESRPRFFRVYNESRPRFSKPLAGAAMFG